MPPKWQVAPLGNSNSTRPTPVALLVFNLSEEQAKQLEAKGGSVSMLLDEFEKTLVDEGWKRRR